MLTHCLYSEWQLILPKKKKHSLSFKHRNRFHYETPLPVDLALERLQAMSTQETSYFSDTESYRVSFWRSRDSILFEIRVMTSWLWTPATLSGIISGHIREVDPTRTLIEGDMRIPSHVRVIGISFVIIFAIATPLLFFSGHLPVEEFLLVVGASTVCLTVFIRGKNDSHPAIYRLNACIQPQPGDQDLIALRQKQHLDQLTNELPAASTTKAAQPAEDAQERG